MPTAIYVPGRVGEGFFADFQAPAGGATDNGKAWLWNSGTGKFEPVALAYDPTGTAAAAIATHVALADPHTQYLLADGSRDGASAAAQAFGLGVTAIAPDVSTSALLLRSARAAIAFGNVVGGIDFQSNDTSLTAPGTVTARILAVAGGTHTTTQLVTDLAFYTTNGLVLSEAMRLSGANLVTMPGQVNAGWIRNSIIAVPGQGANDLSMVGVLYDRNELTLADARGTVTVNITGAGTLTTNTVGNPFDIRGGYLTITGTDVTTTQIQIQVDLGAATANYGSATWQPFLQWRLSWSNTSGSKYRNIVVEVSSNGTTWLKPAGGQWETTDASAVETINGLWMGTNAQPGVTWRYARFTLTDRVAGATNADQVWISALGLRHYSAPATRALVSTRGDTVYGPIVLRTDGTAALDVKTAAGTSVFTVDTTNGAFVAPEWAPSADGTNALRITKANKTTDVVVINTTSSIVDVAGTLQADAIRIDQTPAAGTITPTHTITISLNGTNYKFACVAA